MSLGNALGYLTVLPVPYKKHIPLLRSIHFFPFVGAGMGSAAVLFFLACRRFLPDAVSGLLTLAVLQLMSGGASLHGLAEMAQGRQTYPGHGFEPGFKLGRSGAVAVAAVLLFKSLALASLPPEWLTRAIFLIPILGRCVQVMAFILSRQRLPEAFEGDPAIARRRVRAGFMSAALLLLLFLFPWRVALPALGLFALVSLAGLKICNVRFQGLTLQTVSFLTELTETSVLVLLAASAQALKGS